MCYANGYKEYTEDITCYLLGERGFRRCEYYAGSLFYRAGRNLIDPINVHELTGAGDPLVPRK